MTTTKGFKKLQDRKKAILEEDKGKRQQGNGLFFSVVSLVVGHSILATPMVGDWSTARATIEFCILKLSRCISSYS
jgi:hypothetical protein